MNTDNYIESIKSVTIRSIEIKKRLLMSSSKVMIFESFLKENIGNEVLVVNTNIGMEVYYYSKNNYSRFIRESVLLYTIKNVNPLKLKFRDNLTRKEVYQSFCEALITFSQYPQLFLAYAKKFIYLKKEHDSSKFVMPVLDSFFEEVLAFLVETGKIPHYEKVKSAKFKSQILDIDNTVIKDLISEILLKKHYN
ncbi:hypothetical protein ABW636_03635 [Aquimarina sp. 2201CG1-2-11]|uniref:hypothetical protein n=1 Tax=Aquimarina discodermiae TaxID=3231043 RepID=UPI003463158E